MKINESLASARAGGWLRSAITACATLALFAVQPAVAQKSKLDVSKEVAVVKTHLATAKLKSALEFVEEQIADPSDVIQDWIGVCNAPGPSHDEIFRSRQIYKMFRIYGLEEVYIDDVYNVIAVRRGKGNGPTVVLNAHHDNVPIWPKEQPVNAYERDGRIYCPAAGDDIPGVVQLFTVLRAMQAANLETDGDVWFVTFSGEETGSPGAVHFARAHYPHNLDWKRGDAFVQLHGGAGQGVTTGSGPVTNRATLRIFTPFERRVEDSPGADRRWRTHAVDVLARILIRIRTEVSDPRPDCLRCVPPMTEGSGAGRPQAVERAEKYLNISMVQGSPVVNRPTSEASVRIDMRAATLPMLRDMQTQVRKIAEEACGELKTKGFPPHFIKERCGYVFAIDEHSGRDPVNDRIPGWDFVNNPQARFVTAAGNALYGLPPEIIPGQGCGDCKNLYKGGLPGMSFRGEVTDHGKGKFEADTPDDARQGGHDVTESMSVSAIWAGVKHALVFAVSYAGQPGVSP
jgi:acetylornithine deacetylase/succinyl-diaminopimelate desuccinylase-like protein